jgi:hypothetical protein
MQHLVTLVAAVVLTACSATSSLAPERLGAPGHELAANWGTFGMLDTEQLFRYGLEYRAEPVTVGVRPIVGVSYLEDDGTYVYVGGRLDHEVLPGWRLSPSFAAGLYDHESFDLGGPVEFRSGLDVLRHLDGPWWLGVGGYHLSNGGIYSRNGGSEVLLFSLTYAF